MRRQKRKGSGRDILTFFPVKNGEGEKVKMHGLTLFVLTFFPVKNGEGEKVKMHGLTLLVTLFAEEAK